MTIAIRLDGDDDPEEQIAVLRPGGDVGREVPRVDVGDAGDERRPEEREDPETRAVDRLVDRPKPGAGAPAQGRRSLWP